MKKAVPALPLLVGLSTTAANYAALPQTTRIGTDITYIPSSSKDVKGDFVGFDIGLGNEMCKRIQIKCAWAASDFDTLIPSLKARKTDVIISSLSIAEKRQQEITFSDKPYATDLRLIAAEGSPTQLTLDSLKDKHVGIPQGSAREAYANDNWRSRGADVVAYANQDLIYSDLTTSRLDAALQDGVAASEDFLKQPAGKDYAFAGPPVKDKKYFGDGTGIGLREDDAELEAALDKALGELRKDGIYDKMASEYSNFSVYSN